MPLERHNRRSLRSLRQRPRKRGEGRQARERLNSQVAFCSRYFGPSARMDLYFCHRVDSPLAGRRATSRRSLGR